MKANYRKYNDRSLNSSTYHKKDGTAVRAKLKQELQKEVKNEKTHEVGTISDRELKKRVRKELPPPPRKHKSEKDYRRNPKHKKDQE